MAHRAAAARRIPWRLLGWTAAFALLLVPAIAMQFTTEVMWTELDFMAAGALIGAAGLAVEVCMQAAAGLAHRAAALVMIGGSFLLVWVNLAVRFLGSETNPANLMFAAILLAILLGSIATRCRAAPMARVMLGVAILQAAIGAAGLAADWASPGAQGVFEVALGTALFVTLWLVSAALFRQAARAPGADRSAHA